MTAFSPDPECKMPICTKTAAGRLLLPSANCHCAQNLGPGRMSLPPLIWFLLALGMLAYAWFTNLTPLQAAWQSGGWKALGALAADAGNLFLPLNLFALFVFGGGMYELRKRRQELEARRPFMSCEPVP
ncbi:MAG: hypothetical protein LBP61_09130 [Desulfovibrio sp.]|jgi:hypothetical protein|nr:hypothetical protein [Desulfovibrio sp.]